MDEPLPSDLRFTYQKGNFYRMIHVDGAVGGVGPNGRYIHLTMFSERRSIPKAQVFDISDDGTLADDPKHVEDITGVFRELEACAVMDIQTAKSLHRWLGEKIAERDAVAKKIIAEAAKRAEERRS